MFIDTLYFHYVVIWKKTDLSRFFFLQNGNFNYIEIDNFLDLYFSNLVEHSSLLFALYILFN